MEMRLIQVIKTYSRTIFICWFVILVLMTLLPSRAEAISKIDIGKIEIRLDYLYHIIIYAIGIFLAILWKSYLSFKISFQRVAIIIICFVLIAVLQEFAQILIPYRAFNINDIISNLMGVITGLPLTFYLTKIKVVRAN